MSDRTEEEEERFIRQHARRLKVSPERLLDALRPHGFFLASADRTHGINQIDYARPTPNCFGLFDQLSLHADITGAHASLSIQTALVPGAGCSARFDAVYPESRPARATDLQCGTLRQARDAEEWIAGNVPEMFAGFHQHVVEFYEVTARARRAADEYLSAIAPSTDLDEIFSRVCERASDEQQDDARRYLATQYLRHFNLERFRLVWEICQLTQVLCWKHEDEALVGLNGYRGPPTPMRVEAHRRLQICASRLAREAGWPIDDPLVPPRRDELLDPAPWRDEKLDAVGAAIDDYLESTDARCACGRLWRYVTHTFSANSSELAVAVRCGASHDGTVAINVAGLRSGM